MYYSEEDDFDTYRKGLENDCSCEDCKPPDDKCSCSDCMKSEEAHEEACSCLDCKIEADGPQKKAENKLDNEEWNTSLTGTNEGACACSDCKTVG